MEDVLHFCFVMFVNILGGEPYAPTISDQLSEVCCEIQRMTGADFFPVLGQGGAGRIRGRACPWRASRRNACRAFHLWRGCPLPRPKGDSAEGMKMIRGVETRALQCAPLRGF